MIAALILWLGSLDAPIRKHASPWVNVPAVTVAVGDIASRSVTLSAIQPGAFLEYEISMPGKALNYAVENLSIANDCPGYDGSYGAAFAFQLGAQPVDGIGYHVGMCGGVNLSTFDGAVDWSGPGGIPYGGSGHNFGVGFPTYTRRVPVARGSSVLTMSVAPTLGFSSWNGDANWIKSGWIDGASYSVRARIVYEVNQ